jgi:ADP-ribose pyrophosphatase YjhB (NUDIX family)
MRSFPGAWVFPGGSVDAEDSCLETAISREIREETGIDATDWTVQSVWESVFPTIPKLNVPIKRHHLVIYLSTRLEETARPSLSLCDEEVDGAVWLSEDNLDGILSKSLSLPNDADQNQDSSIDVLLGPNASSIQKESLHHLAGIYPQFDEIQTQSASVNFGIAQGSLFALEEYWKHNKR